MNVFKAIRDKLASVDEVVPILVLFEMIYLAVGEFIIWVILPVDKPKVGLGFLIGVGFAVLSSIQNSLILKGALSRGKKKSASIGMVIFMLIRIGGISLVVVLALRYGFCSPVAVLVGVLAIQAGVYFEPAFRKRRERKQQAAARVTGNARHLRNPGGTPEANLGEGTPQTTVGNDIPQTSVGDDAPEANVRGEMQETSMDDDTQETSVGEGTQETSVGYETQETTVGDGHWPSQNDDDDFAEHQRSVGDEEEG